MQARGHLIPFAARLCGLLLVLPGFNPAAMAQDFDEVTELDPIDVSAPDPVAAGTSLTEPGQTVIAAEKLDREYSGADLATVLNSVAGVTVETVAGDPAMSVNIRGLQSDGRVAVTIDGARQNFGTSGHTANNTFYADREMLRSISVVRGASGAGAAAGAMGGTVALRTIEAADLLDTEDNWGGEIRLRYGTLSESPTVHLSAATRLGAMTELLVAGTTSEDSDYIAPDGTDVLAEKSSQSLLTKLSHDFGGGQKLTFGLSYFGSDHKSGLGVIPRTDRVDTLNATLNFSGAVGVFDAVDATLYRTETRTAQRRIDANGDTIGPERSYTTLTMGVRAEASTDVLFAALDHRLTFVLDGFQDTVTVDDPTSAGGSLTAPGERNVWSFLVQDSVQLTDRTEAALGLRFDSYRLTSDHGTTEGQQISPSLTLRHRLGPVTFHASLTQSYRPPTLSEALVSGLHPQPADFLVVPNPALKPERSTAYEIGATLGLSDLLRSGDRLDARLAVYRNEVRDYVGFVEQGTLFNRYFQYQNIDQVRLEGVELEVSYDAETLFGSFSGQSNRGIDTETGEDLTGIAPDSYSVTGGWRNFNQRLEIGARYTHTAAREDGTLSSQDWETLDLFLNKKIGDGGTLSIALNNVTDQTYTAYLTTQPAPGFNALASLSWKF